MTVKETAFLLGVSPEALTELIEKGCQLPLSKKTVCLEADRVGRDYSISDEQLDKFIQAFENEEPGRNPPVEVRRILLVEAQHRCAICRQAVAVLQFHHILGWEKVKHHDPQFMLAACGTCHDNCSIGKIDKKSQLIYKEKLQRPFYKPEGPADSRIKRERDLEQLRTLFSQITRNEVNHFFDEASIGYLTCRFSTFFWEGFIAIHSSARFHLYDTRADKLIREFAEPVQGMVHIAGESMHLTTAGDKMTFGGGMSRREDTEKFRQYYLDADLSYRRLYTYLRENYLELDFDRTDAEASESYRRFRAGPSSR